MRADRTITEGSIMEGLTIVTGGAGFIGSHLVPSWSILARRCG